MAYEKFYMSVNLEGVAGSRGSGKGIRIAHEKLNMCVNLEGVAGSRGPGKGIRMTYG